MGYTPTSPENINSSDECATKVLGDFSTFGRCSPMPESLFLPSKADAGREETPNHVAVAVSGSRRRCRGEIMKSNFIEPATDNDPLATLAGSEGTSVLFVATEDAIDIQARLQEDAGIDAEAILTQADEALVLG